MDGLILTGKPGRTFVVNGELRMTIISVRGNRVKLNWEGDREKYSIERESLDDCDEVLQDQTNSK